jgi:hypothetical protein
MKALPNPLYTGLTQSSTQNSFAGLNRRSSASDGEITDMKNMTSDDTPLISPRKPRTLVSQSTNNNGIYALDGLFEVIGTTAYYKGKSVGTVTNSRKNISALGSKIVVLPDKVYYDIATDEFANIESTVLNQKVKFQDGEYAGADAKANTIYAKDFVWKNYFKVGDAVTITGAFLHTQNNQTIVIREIEGDCLRFYENSFTIGETGDDETVTISRTMPDLDYICENDNRLFGCKGDTVYASKLGDVTNWNVFDGIATDSYALNVGSPGDFTGCITYLGYPIFFKEDTIYKLYGSQPSNYRLMRSASLGVSPGEHKSLAIAGEILFYMSRIGVVAYSGATPSSIFLPFNDEKFTDCVAGSDGRKYYVSMKKANGQYMLAVYDTIFNVWHIEDNTEAVGFAYFDGLYIMTPTALLLANGVGTETINSYVEFADETLSAANKKSVSKIAIRCTVLDGANLTVKISYDSGAWHTIKTLPGNSKKSYYLPVIPHRCDHFKIRLEGSGRYIIHSITREYSYGSMN